jgi:hypothetical protein
MTTEVTIDRTIGEFTIKSDSATFVALGAAALLLVRLSKSEPDSVAAILGISEDNPMAELEVIAYACLLEDLSHVVKAANIKAHEEEAAKKAAGEAATDDIDGEGEIERS